MYDIVALMPPSCISRTFLLFFQAGTFYPLYNDSHLSSFQPRLLPTLCVFINLSVLYILWKMTHMVFAPLSQAYFTQINVFKVHPCCSIRQNFSLRLEDIVDVFNLPQLFNFRASLARKQRETEVLVLLRVLSWKCFSKLEVQT